MTMNCYEKAEHCSSNDVVRLSFDERNRSRGRATTAAGGTIAWFLPRGIYLRQNDVLKSDCGQFIQVIAAVEPVSRVTSDNAFLLTRAAYHLGNRHVPLQVTPDTLIYQPDHVLDDMIRGLGLAVEQVESAFQPEDGAYHAHAH